MQAMRCLLSGGKLVLQPFPQLLQVGAIARPTQNYFLSLVPTQLQRLLTADWDAVPWLRQFTAILLGGAPPWTSLLQAARDLELPLAPTYGMTETASQVVTLRPAEFLTRQSGTGRVLPHAALVIRDREGNALPPNQVGQISIVAESLALAYGHTPLAQPFQTQDLGYVDDAGFLHVVGRAKTLIITGGEKVLPEEVEAAIMATGLVRDAAVLGLPDADWGERVVAIVAATEADAATSNLGSPRSLLRQALKVKLSPYKIPKQWFIRSRLPRNAQGKLNRAALRQWVLAQIGSTAATTGSAPASEDGAGE
jgi:O-succinylbenzoic acid--CoA ligase